MKTLILLLALSGPAHWMPGDDELCRTPPPPPRWVCEDDPQCWCLWEHNPERRCWQIEALYCAKTPNASQRPSQAR